MARQPKFEPEFEFHFIVAKDREVKLFASLDQVCDYLLIRGYQLLAVSDDRMAAFEFASKEADRRLLGGC